jgi:ferredoxin-nitrite reductase
MSGLDNVRNMVGSPIAGIDPLEMYDTRSLTKALEDWYTNNGKGNSEWGNLPRKFNIAVSGGRDDFAHTSINDIGLNPVPHSETGDIGFNIDLGGYMSIKRAAKSIPMGVWIPETDALDFCKAVLRIFRDMGARKDRQKARLMWLIEEMGMDSFKEMVRKEMSEYKGSEYVFTAEQHHKEEWTHGHRSTLGVNTQKQDGMSWVGVHVPVGRLHPDECEELAALADKYSAGEMRLTVEQNVLFPNVDNAKIEEFRNEPVFTKEDAKFSIDPSNILGHVISCTGAQFCPVALVETKYEIDAFTRELDKIVDMPKAVRIHMTGCPNSCGQAQVADIGLMGAPAKKDGKAVPGVNIFVGGQIGENALLAMDPEIKGIPMTSEDLVPVLANLLVERFGGKLKANFADLVSSEVGSKIKADA